ncbi:MAG: hypothetical protein OEX82_04715 [Nitrosomonas sp.]|nr:hypothetical protein [Nitrosomonas sp.]
MDETKEMLNWKSYPAACCFQVALVLLLKVDELKCWQVRRALQFAKPENFSSNAFGVFMVFFLV